VDFGLSIRATEPDSVAYRWTLTDVLWNESEVVEEADSVSHTFDFCGNYEMEGLAYWGDTWDVVVWDVEVRAAIWGYVPDDTRLDLTAGDSAYFELQPFNWESDSLIYTWYLNNEVVGDSPSQWIRFDAVGDYNVKGVLIDSADVDSVVWEVNVTPNDISSSLIPHPSSLALFPPMPNPFNSEFMVRYSIPRPAEVSLRLYDLTGREVAILTSGDQTAGIHQSTFHAGSLSSGIYILRLDAAGVTQTGKVLIMNFLLECKPRREEFLTLYMVDSHFRGKEMNSCFSQ
jgi:hypothetical protein